MLLLLPFLGRLLVRRLFGAAATPAGTTPKTPASDVPASA